MYTSKIILNNLSRLSVYLRCSKLTILSCACTVFFVDISYAQDPVNLAVKNVQGHNLTLSVQYSGCDENNNLYGYSSFQITTSDVWPNFGVIGWRIRSLIVGMRFLNNNSIVMFLTGLKIELVQHKLCPKICILKATKFLRI